MKKGFALPRFEPLEGVSAKGVSLVINSTSIQRKREIGRSNGVKFHGLPWWRGQELRLGKTLQYGEVRKEPSYTPFDRSLHELSNDTKFKRRSPLFESVNTKKRFKEELLM